MDMAALLWEYPSLSRAINISMNRKLSLPAGTHTRISESRSVIDHRSSSGQKFDARGHRDLRPGSPSMGDCTLLRKDGRNRSPEEHAPCQGSIFGIISQDGVLIAWAFTESVSHKNWLQFSINPGFGAPQTRALYAFLLFQEITTSEAKASFRVKTNHRVLLIPVIYLLTERWEKLVICSINTKKSWP